MAGLEGVVVGDVLAHSGAWSGIGLTKVKKITKTLIICGVGRFNRERGWQQGGGAFSRSRVWVPTPDNLLEVRIQRAQRAIKEVKVDEASVDAIEALLATLKPEAK